ncbi:GIY-YIG nuclease family protein [Streptomyces sp. NPDC015680]|uniref:GIY-YIG nuclease family protein n=1 Tax=Streptomyces sp. NPDC015680 TaxID=3364962 RepID=UPI0036F58D9E
MSASRARVYLIGSAASTLVKIGWSDNPERRLRDLQTGSPLPLRSSKAAPSWRPNFTVGSLTSAATASGLTWARIRWRS